MLLRQLEVNALRWWWWSRRTSLELYLGLKYEYDSQIFHRAHHRRPVVHVVWGAAILVVVVRSVGAETHAPIYAPNPT